MKREGVATEHWKGAWGVCLGGARQNKGGERGGEEQGLVGWKKGGMELGTDEYIRPDPEFMFDCRLTCAPVMSRND